MLSQLEKLKLKLGDSSVNEGLLNLYLEDAKDEILTLTHLSEVPSKLLSTQVDLAIFYYNKQGIEGQTSHSEGGVSRTYEKDIPKRLKKKILAFRKLPRSCD